MIQEISSLQQFKAWVNNFKSELSDKQILLLSGPMGVGKTQFVKTFLQGEAEVMSPTFAIHNSYNVDGKNIDHIDLYRVENDEDLESTGFWDIFNQPNGLIIIEWADRLPTNAYPLNWDKTEIKFEFVEPNTEKRKIEITHF